MANLPEVSIIVPAFNEEDGIKAVISDLKDVMSTYSSPYEIIVVNDGSEDGTGRIAESLDITLINHPTNMGYGASIKSGIRRARYENIAITDADGTYDNRDLPRLLESMDGFEMVVGARTGAKAAIPWIRRPAKWILGMIANFLTETKIPDLNSGIRVFQKEIAQLFFHILPSNFSLTTTITIAMLTRNYNINFVPVNYYKRVGKSKIRPIRDTLNFFSLIIRTVIYFSPLKVFLPISAFLIGLSLVKMIFFDIMVIQNLTDSSFLFLLTGIQIGILGLLADLIDKRMH